ncbi:MAG: ROK family protein [Propioniciclava sp.]|uniref:ROK family protein n=1 Tax=Propioniciclava sp. TaxID=2038686 RepID=UPI0039E41B1C
MTAIGPGSGCLHAGRHDRHRTPAHPAHAGDDSPGGPGFRLGLDVGGSKTHGVILAPDGSVLADQVAPTETGPAGVFATCMRVALACLDAAGVEIGSAGVGIPGLVDAATGEVRSAVNLEIDHLPLGARLSRAWGVPVRVENDVKAAALGARQLLGEDDLALVNIGTGVAAAAIVDGRLVRGPGNEAGEVGHLPIDPAGPWCGCGQRGCIEAFAGGGGISARLAGVPGVALPTLVDAARAGHPAAREEVHRICTGIAAAVQVSVLALGSPVVVLTGGVIHVAPGLVDETRALLRAQAAASAFVASLALDHRIITLPSGQAVGALGAALLA